MHYGYLCCKNPTMAPLSPLDESSFIIGRTDSLARRSDMPGCQIFFFEQGRCIISCKEQRVAATPGDMAIVLPETSFVPLRTSRNFSCTYLWVDDRIMEKAYNRLTNMAFWDFIYQYPIFPLSERQRQMFTLWLGLTRTFVSEKSGLYRDSLLGNQMLTLFMGIDNELIKSDASGFVPDKSRTFSILGRFMSMLTTDSGHHHDVGHYADRLCITPDYLNKITHRYYKSSPKEMIDSYLVDEIKSYLSLKNYTIKEIATRLGFTDASYMCRFFRRHTGRSPLDYRMHPDGGK